MNRRRRLIVLAPLLAIVASMPVPVSATAASAASASTVCVEIVVDYGQLYSGHVSASCVVVAADATGAQVLDARAEKLGVPKPRYRADGLLCAIDGRPKAPDCAEQTGDGGFKYWSYWHKQRDSAWQYAQSGPFDYTMTGEHPGEGWSWVEGTENNSRPPAPVSYERVCPLSTPRPQATTSKPAPGTSHRPSSTSARTRASSPQTSSTTTSPSQPAQSSSPSTANAAGTTPSPTSSETAIADPPREPDGGGTPLPALLAGAAVIVGLGGAAFWRARRTDLQ